MSDKLIFILPVVTLLLFFFNIFLKGNTVQSSLIFILGMLPFMDLKITTEAWGGFKTFDAICFFCFVFLFKEFVTINLKARNDHYFFLFLALSIIILLGGLASEFPGRTYLYLFKSFPVFIFGRFFMTECLKDNSFYLRALRALKFSFLIDMGFLLMQLIVGLKFTFYPGLARNTVDPVFHIVRYPGIFYDSQAHGQFLALGSFMFLYMHDGIKRNAMLFNYFIFGLSIVALALAGSRSAFGGFAIGLFVVLLFAAKRYRIYAIAIGCVSYLVFVFASPETGVFGRAKNLSEDYLFRKSIWDGALEISSKHPYLGIGSGNYQKYVMRHAQDQYLEIEDGQLVYFDQPENGYLKILVELGYLGFFIFCLYLLAPLMKGFYFYFKDIYDKQVVFFMASLISWMVAFNTVYSIYDYRLLVMVVSMIVLTLTYPMQQIRAYEVAE